MQADGTFRYVADFPVDPAASSTSRELDALLFALLRDAAVFAAGKTRIVYWQTDSQVGARVLQIGSRIPELQRKIFLIKSVEKMAGFAVLPVWSPRDHLRLQQADAGSRLRFSSDEWSIDRRDLAAVFAELAFVPCGSTRVLCSLPSGGLCWGGFFPPVSVSGHPVFFVSAGESHFPARAFFVYNTWINFSAGSSRLA